MGWEIIEGDCLEVMRGMDENSVDAIIADPPYCAGAIGEAARTRAKGQGLRSENLKRFGWFVGDNMGTAGLSCLLRSCAVIANRIIKSTGSMLVFCDWRMMATIEPAIESSGMRFQGLVVWDKGSMGLGRGFRNRHELILHFTVGAPEYHSKSIANVIQVNRVRNPIHQTQKPVELLRQLIEVVSPPRGVVLDPFAGSGSIGVAAVREGRDFIGIELNPEYCDMARARIANDMPLFNQEVTNGGK